MTEVREDKGWCVVELLGHRKMAGYVRVDGNLDRVDIFDQDPGDPPAGDVAPIATAWFGGAVYCVTATTKEMCLKYTQGRSVPAPIGRWEIAEEVPTLAAGSAGADDDGDWGPEG